LKGESTKMKITIIQNIQQNDLDHFVPFNLPHIKIKLENMETFALCDTGAEMSLINQEYWDSLNKTGKLIPIKNIKVVTANRKLLALVNKIYLTKIKIGKKEYDVEFLIVKGLKKNCILGINILELIKAKIYVEEKKIRLGDEEIIWVKEEEDEIKDDEKILNCLRGKFVENKDITQINGKKINKLEIDCMEKYKIEVKNILNRNYALINDDPSVATQYTHSLIVDESQPFTVKNYPIPYKYKNQVEIELRDMLEKNIIEQKTTNFINPVVIVEKKINQLECV
jgi:predicted aspartyl protease